ncbi:MAG: AAA family ATPase [Muribaculaceae bacterium]|nr:AAA family ATPase [Muribaculaceae bacterium]
MKTKPIKKHIDRLLLDPNNYRFIDNPKYVKVKDENAVDLTIQQRSANFLRGKNNENIEDLINSFKTNGILRQDPIQVKKTAGDNYIVIEGNRRVATLKYLYSELKNHGDIGVLKESDFKSIDLIEIEGEDRYQELIAMGLNHIGGKKKWSPLNQATLIQDLITDFGMTKEDVCNSLGISKQILNKNLRTLALIRAYKDSDFGDQFETTKFSIFEEIVKSPDIRNWLGWDENKMAALNLVNQEKIFSWISKAEIEEEEEDDSNSDIEKEKFTRIELPIITKSSDIRELAKFINDSKALSTMESARSVTKGLIDSEALGGTRIHNAIKNIGSEIDIALKFCDYIGNEDRRNFEKLQTKLRMLLSDSNSGMSLASSAEVKPLAQEVLSHFTSVDISNYRRIKNIKLSNLKQLNLFVGPNNSGKTSMLECFFLITRLNDLASFLEIEQLRSKSDTYNPEMVVRNTPECINVSGSFNQRSIDLSIEKKKNDDNIDRTGYLTSIYVNAILNKDEWKSYANIYQNAEPQIFYSNVAHLCRACFSSPYIHTRKIVQKAHDYVVKQKRIDRIIQFIKTEVDSTIEDIQQTNPSGESRFIVTSSSNKSGIDITKYGEGLQRIFEIALLLSYCSNGILCIDEIDSGIHYKLLKKFTSFIMDLAKEYNVQLFISTHSKECVDAFAALNSDSLIAYKMKVKADHTLDFRYIGGKRLNDMVEEMDIDIR